MTTPHVRKSHPAAFFVLVYALSAPFWIIGDFIGKSSLPDNIPVTDIGATLSPFFSACILVFRENGVPGLKAFLARVYDYKRIERIRWLIAAIVVFPVLYVGTYAAMRIAGVQVTQSLELPSNLLGVFAMFTIAATLEELGYSAYAADTLQKRFSALITSLLIGLPWAMWHLPSMIHMGQTSQLIAWGLLATVAFRVLTVWLYNNSNFSLFVVIVAHAVGTTARSAFPGGRDGYELGQGAISYGIIILAAIFVTAVWGQDDMSSFLGRRVRRPAA